MRTCIALLCCFGSISVTLAADAPVPTKSATSKMKLPPGFEVTLFAGEPDVVQPIAFTFDDRGRMWVVECVMYPKWSQDGKGGKDRVIILEDTDGDGQFDKKTVVLDDGVNLSGIELGFGGVYLCSSPNLIFIPITNDKPGKPEILLDGWNIKDAKHNVFNSLIWGPDGWLYGCNGIQTKSYVGRPGTPQDKRVFFDCGVWRFHPLKKQFEVVANGTTNPWGLDFDEHGEMFITNCVIDHLFHFAPGGHYQRMYGTDPNPRVYGSMNSCVDYKHWGSGAWTDSRADMKTGVLKKEHDDAGGGHAHSGAAIYLGTNFPAEYRNTMFTCNIHGNRLNNDGLKWTGTGMKGERRKDFFFANDPWFRGICVKQGPEGGLYVSDWSDTGECHNYDKADISNGRIYRITYGKPKGFKGDLSKLSTPELVQALISEDEWLARKARRILQERAAAKEDVATAIMALHWDQDKPIRRNYERKFWALQAVGGITAENYKELDKDNHSGHWLLQFGLEAGSEQAIQDYRLLFGHTRSVDIQIHMASMFMRLDKTHKLLSWRFLVDKPVTDHNLTWMLWYAIEPLVSESPNLAIRGARKVAVPQVRRNMFRLYAEVKHADEAVAMKSLTELLENADNDLKRDILLGLKEAYADRSSAKALPGWSDLTLPATTTADVRDLVDELSIKFGDATKIDKMKLRIAAKDEDAGARNTAIRLLAGAKVPGLAPLLLQALADDKVRGAAIRALAAYPDEQTPEALLGLYAKLTPEEKADAVQTLISRAAYASKLLDAVERGTVPKADITAFTARQILTIKDASLKSKLARVWGEVKPASANRVAQITKLKTLLTASSQKDANALNGKALFTKNCATCHKLHGEGESVGPELTGSQRGNLDYLLENIVDPSAVVANEYKLTNFFLADGRTISGIIKQENAVAFTVRTLNDTVIINKKDIDERKPTNTSIMPDGLFDVLKEQEIRDLVAYLQSNPGR